jgi:uncharacterized protein (TIGR03437 family)
LFSFTRLRDGHVNRFILKIIDVALQLGIDGRRAAAPLQTPVQPVTVTIGGVPARVDFAGLAPGYTGLFQVNAKVPESIHPGDAVSVQIMTHRPDGSITVSNVVTIAVAAAN